MSQSRWHRGATALRINVPAGDPLSVKQDWGTLPAYVGLDDNFLISTKGGDVTRDGNTRTLMQWSGEEEPGSAYEGWANHVFRVNYDINPMGEADVSVVANSIRGSGGEHDSHPFVAILEPGDFTDFRSDTYFAHPWQSLRMGDLTGDGTIYAAVSTSGGRLLIINTTTNDLAFVYDSREEERDYGYGGMALAIGDLDGDPAEEIIFGNIFRHTDSNGTRHMDASLIVFDWNGAEFYERQEIHLGELGLDPTLMPGLGIAGIAIANIDPQPDPPPEEGHPGNEVIVSTLNGELYIFTTDGGLPIFPTPLHASVHEGSLGGSNSISVADLDGDGILEIYLASSRGIYRFNVTPLPTPPPPPGGEEGEGGVEGGEGGG